MSESKVFCFPDSAPAGNNNIDPALLMALNNNGGFGGNGNWLWVIFLFFLYPLLRNGGLFGGVGGDGGALGTGYLSNQIMNGSGRELLMQAIQGNRDAVNQLSTQLGASIGNVLNAVNNVVNSVQLVGNLVGMNAMQTINAVQAGNTALGQLIAQCCCDNKLLVTTQGYENLIATLNQTNALQNAINNNTVKTLEGFTTVTFLNQTLTANLQRSLSDGVQAIKDATNSLTSSILAKLDAIEDSRKDREINTLTAQLAAVNAKAERTAELAPIVKQLDQIQCALPTTVTTNYQPFTAVPNCVAYLMGLYGLNGAIGYNNGSIWS